MGDAKPEETVVMGDLNEPSGCIHAWLRQWGLESPMRSLDVENQIPTYIAPAGKRARPIDWMTHSVTQYVLPTATDHLGITTTITTGNRGTQECGSQT